MSQLQVLIMSFDIEKWKGLNEKTKVVHAMRSKDWTLCSSGEFKSKTNSTFKPTQLKVTCKRCLRELEKRYNRIKKMPQTDYEWNELMEEHVVEFDEKKHTTERIGNFPNEWDPWLEVRR